MPFPRYVPFTAHITHHITTHHHNNNATHHTEKHEKESYRIFSSIAMFLQAFESEFDVVDFRGAHTTAQSDEENTDADSTNSSDSDDDDYEPESTTPPPPSTLMSHTTHARPTRFSALSHLNPHQARMPTTG